MVLTIACRKGGVGKTTTAANLAIVLGRDLRLRVLLLELDPQGSLGRLLAGDRLLEHAGRFMEDVFSGLEWSEAIIPGVARGVDLVPATTKLTGTELNLVSAPAREKLLAELLEEIEGEYDVVICDTSAALGLLAVNAIAAADLVLSPISCEEPDSIDGVREMEETFEPYSRRERRSMPEIRLVLTRYDERATASKDLTAAAEEYPRPTCKTRIPEAARVRNLATKRDVPRQAIAIAKPDHKVTAAHRALAQELLPILTTKV